MSRASTHFIALIAVSLTASLLRGDETASEIAALDNSDIKWVGQFSGLDAQMSVRARAVSRKVRERDLDQLIEMIEDPKRFTVAHVILARIYQAERKSYVERYHGLRVVLHGNGDVTFPTYTPEDLGKYWKDIHRKHKPKLIAAEEPQK